MQNGRSSSKALVRVCLAFCPGWIGDDRRGNHCRALAPVFGGLFLAFPAIFCTTATLIEKHEPERKQNCGLAGHGRGSDAATPDAPVQALAVSTFPHLQSPFGW
jgi:hypothetical protein